MLWSQQMRKLFRYRRYWIMFIIVFSVVMGVFGTQILGGLARTCPEPPEYGDDVSPDTRAKIDMLYDRGLLYCAQPSTDQAEIDAPIFWGSDGVVSLLYFQAGSMQDVAIRSYAFGDGYDPPPLGGARPAGFVPVLPGGKSLENQAPAGVDFYYREDGAPGDGDFAVNVYITGPAAINEEATGRDFWRDLNVVLAKFRGESVSSGAPSVTTRFPIPILPERSDAVRATWVNPELADEDGKATFAMISTAELQEPTLYQSVSGLLASSVWIAGVITGTNPTMAIAPLGSEGEELAGEVDAMDSGLWRSPQEGVDILLAHFAFPVQPTGTEFEARYWQEASLRGLQSPDYVWSVSFPSLETEDGGS